MTHYVHYWTPLRAQRAFGDRRQSVSFLDNGWFKSLTRGDVLWILTKTRDKLILAFRGDVVASPRRIKRIPPYAVGNSAFFNHHRVRFDSASASLPHGIPFPLRDLKRLRFHGRSKRVAGSLNDILVGPMASLREVQRPTIRILEAAWRDRDSHPWVDLEGPGLAPRFAIDLRPPRAKRRIELTISRIVRDTASVAMLKKLHRHRCQICGAILKLGAGNSYSEGHHLQPLGGAHDGPDVPANIVIVCPNHHAQLDFAGIAIAEDGLRRHREHVVSREFIDYHNRLVRQTSR